MKFSPLLPHLTHNFDFILILHVPHEPFDASNEPTSRSQCLQIIDRGIFLNIKCNYSTAIHRGNSLQLLKLMAKNQTAHIDFTDYSDLQMFKPSGGGLSKLSAVHKIPKRRLLRIYEWGQKSCVVNIVIFCILLFFLIIYSCCTTDVVWITLYSSF